MDRQKGRQTNKERKKQTQQIDIQMDIQTDRLRDRQTDRHDKGFLGLLVPKYSNVGGDFIIIFIHETK